MDEARSIQNVLYSLNTGGMKVPEEWKITLATPCATVARQKERTFTDNVGGVLGRAFGCNVGWVIQTYVARARPCRFPMVRCSALCVQPATISRHALPNALEARICCACLPRSLQALPSAERNW